MNKYEGLSFEELSIEELAHHMGRVRHFRDMPQTALRQVVGGGIIQHHKAGEIIFLQAEPSAGMFVLFDGRVRLSRINISGQEQIVTMIEPVIMFNEVTILDGKPNPVTAIAEEDSITWNITYETFQKLIQRFPQIGLSLLSVLATRNRVLVELCADLSFRPVVARLAKLLLALSHHGREVIDRREVPIQHMGARISAVPEAISRSLTLLREQEAIEVSRTEIRIIRADILANLAQMDQEHPCCS